MYTPKIKGLKHGFKSNFINKGLFILERCKNNTMGNSGPRGLCNSSSFQTPLQHFALWWNDWSQRANWILGIHHLINAVLIVAMFVRTPYFNSSVCELKCQSCLLDQEKDCKASRVVFCNYHGEPVFNEGEKTWGFPSLELLACSKALKLHISAELPLLVVLLEPPIPVWAGN